MEKDDGKFCFGEMSASIILFKLAIKTLQACSVVSLQYCGEVHSSSRRAVYGLC